MIEMFACRWCCRSRVCWGVTEEGGALGRVRVVVASFENPHIAGSIEACIRPHRNLHLRGSPQRAAGGASWWCSRCSIAWSPRAPLLPVSMETRKNQKPRSVSAGNATPQRWPVNTLGGGGDAITWAVQTPPALDLRWEKLPQGIVASRQYSMGTCIYSCDAPCF